MCALVCVQVINGVCALVCVQVINGVCALVCVQVINGLQLFTMAYYYVHNYRTNFPLNNSPRQCVCVCAVVHARCVRVI